MFIRCKSAKCAEPIQQNGRFADRRWAVRSLPHNGNRSRHRDTSVELRNFPTVCLQSEEFVYPGCSSASIQHNTCVTGVDCYMSLVQRKTSLCQLHDGRLRWRVDARFKSNHVAAVSTLQSPWEGAVSPFSGAADDQGSRACRGGRTAGAGRRIADQRVPG